MKRIGIGRTAEVFLTEDGRALKLFYEGYPEAAVETELRNALWVQETGLPAPHCFGRLDVQGRSGILYECVTGESLLSRMMRTGDAEDTVCRMVALHKEMRKIRLPQATDIRLWLKRELEFGPMTEEKRSALQTLEKMPDGDTLLHGDFHPDNIQIDGEKTWVLDWMNLCRGDALYDAARTYCLIADAPLPPGTDEEAGQQLAQMRKALAEAYLAGMGIEEERIADWARVIRAQIKG